MSAVIDDEMEAMLREIETMGMTPEVEKTAEPEPEAPVPTPVPEPAVTPVIAPVVTIEDAIKVVVELDKAEPEPEPEPEPDNSVKAEPAVKPTPVARKVVTEIIDTDQVAIDIAINQIDLDNEMIRQPGLELHYSLKTADARRAFERMKSGFEILEAQLDSKYRSDMSDGAGKKPTEAAIRNAVVGDARYASGISKLHDAQHVWKMSEGIESAFRSKKDMILEIARDRRKEREGTLRVMEDTGLRGKVDEMMRSR